MKHLALVLAVLLAACGEPATPAVPIPAALQLPPQALPGGATTVVALNPETARHLDVFSAPAANLPAAQRALFAVGNSFFTQPWVSAGASTTARDGLGPLFNAAACQDCHVRDGRGHPPAGPDDALLAAVLRLATAQGQAHPVYGAQLQDRAIPGHAPEARLRLHWEPAEFRLPDGEVVALRRPRFELRDWAYGVPGALQLGLRVAPPMIGLGLLEAIPADDLRAYAVEQAKRWPEVSGRIAQVRDRETGAMALGRFGWKAAQPSVRQQTLAAFAEDLGITSALFVEDACTTAQTACRAAPQGGLPELAPAMEEALVLYARHLALPARRDHERPEVIAGAALFERIGCAACHRPQWQTGTVPDAPALSQQSIWPYTDLLLHDLGEGLADGISEGAASGREWRTPPLWGLQHAQWVGGPKAGYLHDGRARNLAEAIAWHGGEAQASRDRWAALSAQERRQLIRFLASL